jgi:hypothetical protein
MKWKEGNVFEEIEQAMKHTPNPTFISSKWQDKIQESGLTMCANRLKSCKKLLLGFWLCTNVDYLLHYNLRWRWKNLLKLDLHHFKMKYL